MAILLSIPLQLFPAVRIMENGLFTRSGKLDPRVKWQKNAFRCVVVAGCTLISWLGAADLDKFVAFVGSFAWYGYNNTIHLEYTTDADYKCSVMLRLPSHASLQSLRANEMSEGSRHGTDDIWLRRCSLYNRTDNQGKFYTNTKIILLPPFQLMLEPNGGGEPTFGSCPEPLGAGLF